MSFIAAGTSAGAGAVRPLRSSQYHHADKGLSRPTFKAIAKPAPEGIGVRLPEARTHPVQPHTSRRHTDVQDYAGQRMALPASSSSYWDLATSWSEIMPTRRWSRLNTARWWICRSCISRSASVSS
jgi:hypothetical protein